MPLFPVFARRSRTPGSAWSTTSSRASTSSSTPDDRPGSASRTNRLIASFRLVHPFPSILDGLATTTIAWLAGGGEAAALRLGLAMICLQFSIGALNDLVDAPLDAGRKPGKPIPAGLVKPRTARLVVLAAAALGFGLSALAGPLVLGLAIVGYGAGVLYDLHLKGTPWAWIAFAVAIPLLPVYAWVGAVGSLPAAFGVLVPTAAVAGAAIAIGNSLVDVDRDRATRTLTPAVVLGPRRACRTLAALHAAVAAVALASIPALGGTGPGLLVAAFGVVVAGTGVLIARDAGPVVRERGWRLQAVGLATVAVGWASALGGLGG